jgi:hypothetical protein
VPARQLAIVRLAGFRAELLEDVPDAAAGAEVLDDGAAVKVEAEGCCRQPLVAALPGEVGFVQVEAALDPDVSFAVEEAGFFPLGGDDADVGCEAPAEEAVELRWQRPRLRWWRRSGGACPTVAWWNSEEGLGGEEVGGVEERVVQVAGVDVGLVRRVVRDHGF